MGFRGSIIKMPQYPTPFYAFVPKNQLGTYVETQAKPKQKPKPPRRVMCRLGTCLQPLVAILRPLIPCHLKWIQAPGGHRLLSMAFVLCAVAANEQLPLSATSLPAISAFTVRSTAGTRAST